MSDLRSSFLGRFIGSIGSLFNIVVYPSSLDRSFLLAPDCDLTSLSNVEYDALDQYWEHSTSSSEQRKTATWGD